MRKGRYGVALAFYAVAAFVFAMFESILPLVLLTAFVIAVEDDEWAGKQCIQALVIVVLKWVISEVFVLINLPLKWIGFIITDYESGFHTFTSVISKLFTFAQDLIGIAFLVFIALAIVAVIKEKSANFPLAAQVANWAYGVAKPQAKKCPKCGAPITGKFCEKCGERVED